MKLIKPVIAVFLLLTYSFAFAVELVPHSHTDNISEHFEINLGEQSHSHHRHAENEVITHGYSLNENHSCDGILCLLECFLSKLEDPQSDIIHQHFTTLEINNTEYKGLSKTKIIAVLFAVFVEPTEIESYQVFNTIFIDKYQLSLVKSSPHRGPPSFSC